MSPAVATKLVTGPGAVVSGGRHVADGQVVEVQAVAGGKAVVDPLKSQPADDIADASDGVAVDSKAVPLKKNSVVLSEDDLHLEFLHAPERVWVAVTVAVVPILPLAVVPDPYHLAKLFMAASSIQRFHMVSVPTSPLILHCDRDVAAGVGPAGDGFDGVHVPRPAAQYPHDTSHDLDLGGSRRSAPSALAVQSAVGILQTTR